MHIEGQKFFVAGKKLSDLLPSVTEHRIYKV